MGESKSHCGVGADKCPRYCRLKSRHDARGSNSTDHLPALFGLDANRSCMHKEGHTGMSIAIEGYVKHCPVTDPRGNAYGGAKHSREHRWRRARKGQYELA